MADKLVVVEENYRWLIQWELDDGDDLGGYLCQSEDDGKGKVPKDRGEWEHWAASAAVRGAPGVNLKGEFGAWWESEKEARAALRVAKEALKQDRPMPDWAKTALAEGWKAPKGWKA
jgi:hypothetical protein